MKQVISIFDESLDDLIKILGSLSKEEKEAFKETHKQEIALIKKVLEQESSPDEGDAT